MPKSFGGSNDKSNLVNLTAREHYIAHKLLVNICKLKYGINSEKFRKMSIALYLMSYHPRYKNCKINSKMYALIKEKSSMKGEKNPMYGIDVRTKMTPDAIKEMSRKRSEALRKRIRK